MFSFLCKKYLYTINILWIGYNSQSSSFQNQVPNFIYPSQDFYIKHINPILKIADQNPNAKIIIWYNSKQYENPQQVYDNTHIFYNYFFSGKRIVLRDINDLSFIYHNSSIFSKVKYENLSKNILKLVILYDQISQSTCQNLVLIEHTLQGISEDNNTTKEELFSAERIYTLNKQGIFSHNFDKFIQLQSNSATLNALGNAINLTFIKLLFTAVGQSSIESEFSNPFTLFSKFYQAINQDQEIFILCEASLSNNAQTTIILDELNRNWQLFDIQKGFRQVIDISKLTCCNFIAHFKNEQLVEMWSGALVHEISTNIDSIKTDVLSNKDEALSYIEVCNSIVAAEQLDMFSQANSLNFLFDSLFPQHDPTIIGDNEGS